MNVGKGDGWNKAVRDASRARWGTNDRGAF